MCSNWAHTCAHAHTHVHYNYEHKFQTRHTQHKHTWHTQKHISMCYVAVHYSAQIPHMHPPPHGWGSSAEEREGSRPRRQLVPNLYYHQRRVCVWLLPAVLMIVWPFPLLWAGVMTMQLRVLSWHGLQCPHINRVTHPHHTLHQWVGGGCGEGGWERSEGGSSCKWKMTVYTVLERCYWKLSVMV